MFGKAEAEVQRIVEGRQHVDKTPMHTVDDIRDMKNTLRTDGDLKHGVDFRSVFATVAQDCWLWSPKSREDEIGYLDHSS